MGSSQVDCEARIKSSLQDKIIRLSYDLRSKNYYVENCPFKAKEQVNLFKLTSFNLKSVLKIQNYIRHFQYFGMIKRTFFLLNFLLIVYVSALFSKLICKTSYVKIIKFDSIISKLKTNLYKKRFSIFYYRHSIFHLYFSLFFLYFNQNRKSSHIR